jgi:hypothetical protein
MPIATWSRHPADCVWLFSGSSETHIADRRTSAALSRAASCNTVNASDTRSKNHFGLYNPATATFTLQNRRPGWDESPSENAFVYGNPNLKPLIGDWDGDGTETVGIWNAGTFALRNSNTSGFGNVTFNYGNATDVPLAGDWTGQKKTTVGVAFGRSRTRSVQASGTSTSFPDRRSRLLGPVLQRPETAALHAVARLRAAPVGGRRRGSLGLRRAATPNQ